MPLDIPRLFGSSFNATASRNPLAWMVGVKLWGRSWHQVPAASLPDDSGELCHLAELGFDVSTFDSVRAVALRGWILADDGRLYHRVIAEHALAAWLEKLNQRQAGAAGNAKRWNTGFDPAVFEAQIGDAVRRLEALAPQHKSLARATRRASQRREGADR